MTPLLIVDFDSTFIRDETLDEIAKFLFLSNKLSKDIEQKITDITHQAMNGSLDFRQSLKKRVKLLKIHRNDIREVLSILKERVSPSFIENKDWLKKMSSKIRLTAPVVGKVAR